MSLKISTAELENKIDNSQKNTCFHCGSILPDRPLESEGKLFCCNGCLHVFQILRNAGLEKLYEEQSFQKFSKPDEQIDREEFEFLKNPVIAAKFLKFKEGRVAKVVMYLPAIHCASCIWLLEHLHKIHPALIQVQVNYHAKTASILFYHDQISLYDLSLLLANIGYKPYFSNRKNAESEQNRLLILRLGVAGFAFGNIMLMVLPEYLSMFGPEDKNIQTFLHYLSLLFSLPVLFFSGMPYLQNALSAFKVREINMDIPIALGMITLFSRSVYEILTMSGPGYLDSLAGFIFFLLLGKWYQTRTYNILSFEKNYQTFFPLSVMVINNGEEEPVAIEEIKKGDIIRMRNGEILPFDSILISDECSVDYSFITGESKIYHKKKGEKIFTGGKIIGKKVLLKSEAAFDKAYFVNLWTENDKAKNYTFKTISKRLGSFITITVLITSMAAYFYWNGRIDQGKLWLIISSILIVGCSCAFALSAPFLFGNMSRILAKKNFFVKNPDQLSTLGYITDVILDKTGTLTQKDFGLQWEGRMLQPEEWSAVASALDNSIHPLSREIVKFIRKKGIISGHCENFVEMPGRGIEAFAEGYLIKAGNQDLLNGDEQSNETRVYLEINGSVAGYFSFNQRLREGLEKLNELQSNHIKLHILTGDHPNNVNIFKSIFGNYVKIKSRQNPGLKKNYVEQLQKKGKKVLMVGDGLNDIPALQTADFGIGISNDAAYFAPSGDAIMPGENIALLPKIMKFANLSMKLLYFTYFIALLYNLAGLTLAFSGQLSPLTAAILMPMSSVTSVLVTVAGTEWLSKKVFKKDKIYADFKATESIC